MIHHAGPLQNGLQCCMRCGEILSDYRHAMIPVGDPLPTGWAVGAFVEGDDMPKGYARSWWLTEAPPNCPESTEYLAANGKPIDGYPRQQA